MTSSVIRAYFKIKIQPNMSEPKEEEQAKVSWLLYVNQRKKYRKIFFKEKAV